MRVLIFGGSGQVGSELLRSMAPLADVLAPGTGDIPRIDLTKFGAVESLIGSASPDIIINAAAYTAVDQAETEKSVATAINADAPGVMAKAAKKLSVPMVHYSTDYVFAGTGESFQTENDPTGPLNHYGTSKLAGEDAIQRANPHHLILRTSWVYSVQGKNFANTILRLAKERDVLNIVADQFGAPTPAALIANATAHAVSHGSDLRDKWGLYHLVASGVTSWFEYASLLIDLAVEKGALPKRPVINGIATKDFKQAAPRPQNSRLQNRKFVGAFEYPLPDWEVGIELFIDKLVTEKQSS